MGSKATRGSTGRKGSPGGHKTTKSKLVKDLDASAKAEEVRGGATVKCICTYSSGRLKINPSCPVHGSGG